MTGGFPTGSVPTAGIRNTEYLLLSKGVYSVAGKAMAFPSVFSNVEMQKGAFLVSGKAMNLSLNLSLSLEKGAYVVSGKQLTFDSDFARINLEKGIYVVSGKDVDVSLNISVNLQKGTYTISGKQASFSSDFANIELEKGTYFIEGKTLVIGDLSDSIKMPDILITRDMDTPTQVNVKILNFTNRNVQLFRAPYPEGNFTELVIMTTNEHTDTVEADENVQYLGREIFVDIGGEKSEPVPSIGKNRIL